MLRPQPVKEQRRVCPSRHPLRIESGLRRKTLLALDPQPLGQSQRPALVGDLQRLGGLAVPHQKVDVAPIHPRRIGEKGQAQVLVLDAAPRLPHRLQRDPVLGLRDAGAALLRIKIG